MSIVQKEIKNRSRAIFNKLRSLNFRVDIYHTRATKNGFLLSFMKDGQEEFEKCITRREYHSKEDPILVQDKLVIATTGIDRYVSHQIRLKEIKPKFFGDAIASCGGFTQVIIKPTKKIEYIDVATGNVNVFEPEDTFIGKYNFPNNVQYNKSLGFFKAVMRACDPRFGRDCRLIDLVNTI